jgi:ABC-type glycerol-3-phosphate transport system permease component
MRPCPSTIHAAARTNRWHDRADIWLVLATMMLPGPVTMIPNYLAWN